MNFRLPIALPLAVLGATVFLSSAGAQVRGMRVGAPAPRTGVSLGAGARTGYGPRGQRGFFPGWAYWPPPYFYPDYDNNYDYEPPPWVIVAQPADTPAPPVKPAESLVLELQGDQWVRVGRYDQSPTQSSPPSAGPAPTSAVAGGNETSQPLPKLPPTVLVFRDGHEEEVERYAIIGGVIYTRADYWSTGSWTRKVAIAELDVPATLKLNRERGGKFPLPSGPYEVVIRP